ncbi:MAG: endoglucanase [Lachnospiraceae bacterium]|nr:endoglucanase [Lachnospiraceae bacterium]
MHKQIPYKYQNLPIPGGGYVTGFLFSKEKPDTLYLRTDIGGSYRFDSKEKRWNSLSDHVTMTRLDETYPTAIALDESNPGNFYIVCGVNTLEKDPSIPRQGLFAISEDYGNTFTYETIPCFVHGNWNGRGTGLRLIVDPTDSSTLYFASQKDGLLKTSDRGKTWKSISVAGMGYLTLVWISPNGQTLVVGGAGLDADGNPTANYDELAGKGTLPTSSAQTNTSTTTGLGRGHGLFVSYNQGKSFEPLEVIGDHFVSESKLFGLVPQRYDFDGTYLYVTFAMTGRRSYVVPNGYSCDSGDTIAGKVLRYHVTNDGHIDSVEDITPVPDLNLWPNALNQKTDAHANPLSFLDYGFSGISSCQNKSGLLVCSTLCKDDGDVIYLSTDYGMNWKPVLYDLTIGRMDFRAPYMRPECNGGHNLIHWLSDVKINPFDPNELWFNSGTGVFVTHNLLEETVVFSDWCDGLEETVHLNIYSLPSGRVQVVDILGDLGGFAFTDLDQPCPNSFADADGNRYITCINADFSDTNPDTVVITPRGNWTGKTKGGLILTTDGCQTFTRLPMPFGISERIDQLLHRIEHPNVNSGWIAMSSDTQNLVWSIADNITLYMNAVICSQDGGLTWKKIKVFDEEGIQVNANDDSCKNLLFKAFSDRLNPDLMYAFGLDSHFYISTDGGQNFYEKSLAGVFDQVNFGLIDCANKTEIRAESGKEGVLYIAVADQGLWKMQVDVEADSISLKRLTPVGDSVYRLGLGLLREGGDYFTEDKALYVCAKLDGEYGFFRSLDDGQTWDRINTDQQMFGDINSIDGDCRKFGRFYLATGSLGAKYGEMI